MTNHRENPDYIPFLRAVKKLVKNHQSICDAIDMTIRRKRFCSTVTIGMASCAYDDV